ncbi:MAG: ABC transporter ATP-binding protein [Bacteroidetes bacterium]|nr:ABC transporter ATP-binding protein [Bacteroidota bacterium]
MSESIIKVESLSKKFGNFNAVDNISFEVKRGEIYGILGANGAGKSTTIKMLCGILAPTSGTAFVNGFDININPEKVKERIGYMSQKFSLYDDLSVEQNIDFYGRVYGLNFKEQKLRKEWIIKLANLTGRENSSTNDLPLGWKQRLALGCAIIHEPPILFLDEPTSGVDPIMRRKFWEMINNFSAKGTTVIVTTHYLEEAEYCNHIIMMDDGKIIASGSPKELKDKHITKTILEVTCNKPIEAFGLLEDQNWILEITIFGFHLHVMVDDPIIAEKEIITLLHQNEIQVEHIAPITPTLEDVFIYLLEKDKIELQNA